MSQGYSTDASKLGGTQSVSSTLFRSNSEPFSTAVSTAQGAGTETAAAPTSAPPPGSQLPSGKQLSLEAARNGTPLTDAQGKPVVSSAAYTSGTNLTSYRMNPGYKVGDNPDQAFRSDTSVSTVPGDKTQPSIMVRSNGVGANATPVEVQARGNITTSDPAVQGRYIAGANTTNNSVMAGASLDVNPKGSSKGELNASVAATVTHNVTPGAVNGTTITGSAMAGVGPVGVYANGRTNDLGTGSSSTQGEVGARVALDNGSPRTGTLGMRGAMVFAQSNDSTLVNAKTGNETNRSDPRVGARISDLGVANVGNGKISVDAEVSAGQNDTIISASVQYRSNDGNLSAGIEGRYKNNYASAKPDEYQALATVSLSFGSAPSSAAPKPSTLPVPSQPVATQPQAPGATATPPQPSSQPQASVATDGFTRVADLDTTPPATTPSQATTVTAPQPQVPSTSAKARPVEVGNQSSSAIQYGVDVAPAGTPANDRYTSVADLDTQRQPTASAPAPVQSEVAAYQPPAPAPTRAENAAPDRVSVRPYEAPGSSFLPDAYNPLAGIVPAR